MDEKYLYFTCDNKLVSLSHRLAQKLEPIAKLDPRDEPYFLDRDYFLTNAVFSALRFDNFDKLNDEEYEEARLWFEEPNEIRGEFNTDPFVVIVSGKQFRTTKETLIKCNYYKEIFENFDKNPLPLDMNYEAFCSIVRYLRNNKCSIEKKYKDEVEYLIVDYKIGYKNKVNNYKITQLSTDDFKMDNNIIEGNLNYEIYTTENPQITFHKSIYRRHTASIRNNIILESFLQDGDTIDKTYIINNHLLQSLWCKIDDMNFVEVYESIKNIKVSIGNTPFIDLVGDSLKICNENYADVHIKANGLTYLWNLFSGCKIPLCALKEKDKNIKIQIKFNKLLKKNMLLGVTCFNLENTELTRFKAVQHEYLFRQYENKIVSVTKDKPIDINFFEFDKLSVDDFTMNDENLLEPMSCEALFLILKPDDNNFDDVEINGKLTVYDRPKLDSINPTNIQTFLDNNKNYKNGCHKSMFEINKFVCKDLISLHHDYDLDENVYALFFSLSRTNEFQPTGIINGELNINVIPNFNGKIIVLGKFINVLRILNKEISWYRSYAGKANDPEEETYFGAILDKKPKKI